MSFTILEDGRASGVRAHVDGESVRVSPDDLEAALGWALKPQGLCRDEICVPLPKAASISDERGVDLAAFAAALDRPLAIDAGAGAACIGDSASERSVMLHDGEAPDFCLPDLSGRMHALSDQRGRKVLLIAWASW